MDKSGNPMETLSSLEERAKMLKINDEGQHTPSVLEIEQRLANLHGLPMEDNRYSRSVTLYENKVEEETVEKLMRRARDEAMLEREWNRSEKWKDKYAVNPEESIKIRRSDAHVLLIMVFIELSGELSVSDIDIMGQGTVRDLKEIQRMKLAKQRSVKAAKLTEFDNEDHSMDNEIKKLMKLTNLSNLKSEKINEELSKFWKKRLDHQAPDSSPTSENSDDEAEVDYNELERVVMEAEKAENEAIQMIKESKKNGKKSGILSRIFRPR